MKAITPSLMKKIGRLVGADSGADIFEENGKYHYVLGSWGIKKGVSQQFLTG